MEPALNVRYGANQLAGAGIETVNGYSSLEPPRFSDYWWSVVHQDNLLLDLLNARYVMAARQAPGARTFDGTAYYPMDRLMSGTAANPTGREAFRVPPTRVASLALVAAVEGLGEIPNGTPVAEIALVGPDGSRQVVPVRGGVDVAEYRAAEPGWPLADYVGPRVVWVGPAFAPMQAAPGDPVRLYGSTNPLTQPFETVGVEVRVVAPTGRFHLYGLGLQTTENTVVSVRALDKAKYRPLYADQTAALLENAAALPRVTVVGETVVANGVVTADRLHEIAWDPRQQVVIDGPRPDVAAQSAPAGPVGEVSIAEYLPERIVVQADLTAPGYLVLADRFDDGWRAYVDDVETPLLRANGVERMVVVPAGSHVVRFSYAPFPIYLGVGISAVAIVAWLGVLVAAPVVALRARRRASRPT